MKFEELVQLTSELQCFSTSFLFAGRNTEQVRLQLNRWVHEGKVIRIHKGLYTLSKTYRKVPVETPVLSQYLHKPSYLSLQSALSIYNMIPEHVPATTSITTSRPKKIETPFGLFLYRHIKKKYFGGYSTIKTASGEKILCATPEKALLDLIYLTPSSDSSEYIKELRLQHTDVLDEQRLDTETERFSSKKICRATTFLKQYFGISKG